VQRYIDSLIQNLVIVVADKNQFTRRLTRQMLTNLGCRNIIEAHDGFVAVEAIRACNPDVLLLDWKLPILSGEEVLRMIRSPGVFPRPDLPIIMHTDQTEKRNVLKALRAGVHEFLAKPTSPASLRDKLIAVVAKRRPMVMLGDFYVPEPRRLMDGKDSKAVPQAKRV